MATSKICVPADIRNAARIINGTDPVPDYAELLLLDAAAGRPTANTFVVKESAAYLLMMTHYVLPLDPEMAAWQERWYNDEGENPSTFHHAGFTDFKVTFRDTPTLPEIIRGRTFRVLVTEQNDFDRATADEDGHPILD